MKKSLIKNALKFMQHPNYMNQSVRAQLTQSDNVRNIGGGAEI